MAQTHQMRPPGEARWYAPARDITCFTPSAIRAALEGWEDSSNVYGQLGTNVRLYTPDDVQKICEGLAAFCSQECVLDTETYTEAWAKSGLAEVPVSLRMVVMAMIGEQFLSAFWYGVRGATSKTADEEDFKLLQYDPEKLADAAKAMCRLMRMPRWKQKIYIWWDGLRRRLIARLEGKA